MADISPKRTHVPWLRSISTMNAVMACVVLAIVTQAAPATAAQQGMPTIQWATCVIKPSFSPYTQVTYTWSQQAQWVLSSVRADWPPPLGKIDASMLLDNDGKAQWIDTIARVLDTGETVACGDTTPELQPGQGWLMVVEDDENAQCVRFDEHDESARWSGAVDRMTHYAPAIAAVDRWTHPFWLRKGSGVLRLELKGTAQLRIDDATVGKVNGVIVLRLPVGERHLQLDVDGQDDPKELHVHLYPDKTTILRVSVQDHAPIEAPNWYDTP